MNSVSNPVIGYRNNIKIASRRGNMRCNNQNFGWYSRIFFMKIDGYIKNFKPFLINKACALMSAKNVLFTVYKNYKVCIKF